MSAAALLKEALVPSQASPDLIRGQASSALALGRRPPNATSNLHPCFEPRVTRWMAKQIASRQALSPIPLGPERRQSDHLGQHNLVRACRVTSRLSRNETQLKPVS